MILKKVCFMVAVSALLTLISACSQATATPVTVIETVVVKEMIVVKETVEVEKPVEVVVTREVEKVIEKIVPVTVEKEMIVVKTVEVEKEVKVVETVEVMKVVTVEVEVTPQPPTSTPVPLVDYDNPKVYEVLNEITFVQHNYNPVTEVEWFTCASSKGLRAVQYALETKSAAGPRYVGPNCGDFPLWGANGLFEVHPNGTTFFVPQIAGGRFLSPDGVEYERFPLEAALHFFETEELFWTGSHGEAGRIAICDPRYRES